MVRRASIVGWARESASVLRRPRSGAGAILLLLAFIAVSVTALRPAGAVVPVEAFVVSENGGDKASPAISGGLVVWEDRRGGSSDVYGKRVSPAGEEFPIAVLPADQRRPAVSGEFVVWEDDRSGDWDIYGKDLSSGPDAAEIPIVVAPGDQRKPKIGGKKVVWEDWRKSGASGFDLDVYYKDLAVDPAESTGHEIPAPAGNQSNPAISGDTVVWEDDRTGEKNIYGKNLASAGQEFPIGTGGAWQDQPAIDGSLVVWRQNNGNNHDIFGKDLVAKDLETGKVFQITTNGSDQWSPAVSGTVVVWSDARDGNSNTYGKDIATGREFRLTSDASPQETPAIDGDTVVWENQRVGGTNYGAWDIHGSKVDLAPAAPSGATANGRSGGVDLRWQANGEDDLVGYNVYRSGSADGAYAKLNPAGPLTSTSFSDASAPRGVPSFYRITALDGKGNESAPAAARGTAFVAPSLSLAPSVSTVSYVGSVNLSGRISSNGSPLAGKPVILEQKTIGAAAFAGVPGGSLTTRSDGTFSLANVKLTASTEYRARFAGEPGAALEPSASPLGRVNVKALVTLGAPPPAVKQGQALTLSGSVIPSHAGTVKLTIKRNGVPLTTKTASLANGVYRLAYAPPAKGSYSVSTSFAGDADHAGNVSPTRSFLVS